MGSYQLWINGFEIQAIFTDETITEVFIPLLRKLTSMQRWKDRRIIVFLAAPPAAGKSTAAAFLEMLSMQNPCLEPIQAVGIDGFHYHQEYIDAHTVLRNGVEIPMKDVKGCPESYNVDRLLHAVEELKRKNVKWPVYDRRLHDVVEDAIEVNRNIVLIEGNWLLMKEGRWSDLRGLCDYSIMIRAETGALRDRLIQRKVKGGLSAREALQFYETSDKPNILRCLSSSSEADMLLQLKEDGGIVEFF